MDFNENQSKKYQEFLKLDKEHNYYLQKYNGQDPILHYNFSNNSEHFKKHQVMKYLDMNHQDTFYTQMLNYHNTDYFDTFFNNNNYHTQPYAGIILDTKHDKMHFHSYLHKYPTSKNKELNYVVT